MRSWIAVDVTVQAAAVEAVEHAFNILGSLGTEISDLRTRPGDDVCVTGYFDDAFDGSAINNALDEAFAAYATPLDLVVSITSRTVPETDWLAEWKKHWQPTEIGRFIIAPPWSDVTDANKIVIRIEPNMAFGTGTHDTTQLCLRAIDENFQEGISFLDVGTGTGILAIAAAKMSPSSRMVACDVDCDAVRIARENAGLNGVAGRIEFFEGSIDEVIEPFDFVCANLTLDVITPLLSLLLEKSGKFLLLSGILAEQEAAIRTALSASGISDLRSQISNLKFAYSGEWLSILVTN